VLPLAAGINEGGHYVGPSGVRALPLAAGINVGDFNFFFFLLLLPPLWEMFEGDSADTLMGC
jgi:hypothetical protein